MGLRKAAVVLVGVLAAVLSVGQTSASATVAWADDHFKVCLDSVCDQYTEGNIHWGNRTANVSGKIVGGGRLTAHFDAFAVSKVDSEVVYSYKYETPYAFVIGNPSLPGGINRIRTQLCLTGTEGQYVCSGQWNDIRD